MVKSVGFIINMIYYNI